MISENFDINEENSISLKNNISINKSSNKIKFIFKTILLIICICIFILSKNANKKNNNITEN